MKNILLLISIILLVQYAGAQDKIYFKNHQAVMGKVLEIDPGYVTYKTAENPAGPVIKDKKGFIDSIVYENGSVTNFAVRAEPGIHPPHHPSDINYYRPHLSRHEKRQSVWATGENLFGVAEGIIADIPEIRSDKPFKNKPVFITAISYEHTFLRNRFGVEVSPFMGMNKKSYGFTATPRLYLIKHGQAHLSVGLQYLLSHQDYTVYRTTHYEQVTGNLSTLSFAPKLYLHVKKQLAITAETAIGGILDNPAINYSYQTIFKAQLGLAYRF